MAKASFIPILFKKRNNASKNIRKASLDINIPHSRFIIGRLRKAFNRPADRKIPDIKMFLTDCDGCLTDGGMYYSENGDEMKKFNAKDGMGFRLLKEAGIITGIITGEDKALNKRRAEKLKIDELHQGIDHKVRIIRQLCKKYQISPSNVAYVGDDINDIEAIKYVGFGCSVNNAVAQVKKCADYVSPLDGGQGAVRDIIDQILSIDAKKG